MSNTVMIENKKEAWRETAKSKLEKVADTFEEVYPNLVLGYCLFVLGVVVGGISQYKRGFSVGTLSGASLAYSHVIDTLKDLGARP